MMATMLSFFSSTTPREHARLANTFNANTSIHEIHTAVWRHNATSTILTVPGEHNPANEPSRGNQSSMQNTRTTNRPKDRALPQHDQDPSIRIKHTDGPKIEDSVFDATLSVA